MTAEIETTNSDGYAHIAGRWIVRPCVPIGIMSGNWHFAGRPRGMFQQYVA